MISASAVFSARPAKVQDLVRDGEIGRDKRKAVDGHVDESGFREKALQLPAHASLTMLVAPKGGNCAGDMPVPNVDDHRVPIRLARHDPSSRSCDPRHLGQRAARPLKVLQGSIHPRPVEHAAGKFEALRIADAKLDGQTPGSGPALGLLDHRRAVVDARDPACRSHQRGHGEDVVSRASADIEDPVCRAYLQQFDAPAFVRLRPRQAGHCVQVIDEAPCLARAVDVRPTVLARAFSHEPRVRYPDV